MIYVLPQVYLVAQFLEKWEKDDGAELIIFKVDVISLGKENKDMLFYFYALQSEKIIVHMFNVFHITCREQAVLFVPVGI